MRFIKFTPNHLLADTAVTMQGRAVVHPDGRAVTGGELIPNKAYTIGFDERDKTSAAVLRDGATSELNRKERRQVRAKRRSR